MRFQYQIDIKAPIWDVFNIITDPLNQKKWIPGLIDIQMENQEGKIDRIGMQFLQKVQKGSHQKMYRGEVIAYKEPLLVGVRFKNKRGVSTVYYRLRHGAYSDEDYTQLELFQERDSHNKIKRYLNPLSRYLSKYRATRKMRQIKKVAEKYDKKEPVHFL